MVKIIALIALAANMLFMLAGCGASESKGVTLPESEPKKIIIDTDAGADDAAAIMLAGINKNVEILGVTVAAGNVSLEQAKKNALMALELVGNDAPVYGGAETPLDGTARETFSIFGEDGMGDAGLIHPTRSAEDGNAVDFIIETVKNNPGEVEIVTIGPVTNIALAIRKDPEAMKNVKRIWSMGTAGFGQGNATPVAEFNAYKDALAYSEMLASGIKITIIGLDLDTEVSWVTEKQLERMANGNERTKFYAKAVEKLLINREQNYGTKSIDCADVLCMSAVLQPDYVEETAMCAAVCITDNPYALGQVIFYRQGMIYDAMPDIEDYNIELVTKCKNNEIIERFILAMEG